MGVGIRLKQILRQKGMSIKQLSELSGISLNTLYSITKRDSERVDKIVIKNIAKALGIDPLDLSPNAESDLLFFYNTKVYDKLNGIDGFDGFDENKKPILQKGSLAESIFYSEITGFEDEKYVQYRLSLAFSLLNTEGKRKALERVEELTEIPRYQRKQEEGEQGAVDPQEGKK